MGFNGVYLLECDCMVSIYTVNKKMIPFLLTQLIKIK